MSKLYGIKGVLNSIAIKPTVSPIDVKNKIINEFKRNAAIDANEVQVEIKENQVILKGKVRNWFEMQEAVNAAWSVPGVSSVNNQLRLKSLDKTIY